MTPRALALVVLAAGTLPGCGGQDTTADAERVAESFYDAVRREDGEAACALLAEKAREQLESRTSQPCRDAVVRFEHGGGDVVASDVFLTSAQVRLRSGARAFMGREDGRWRLDAVGCTPPPGAPRDQPADCEVES